MLLHMTVTPSMRAVWLREQLAPGESDWSVFIGKKEDADNRPVILTHQAVQKHKGSLWGMLTEEGA